jgi:hypothetical protein
MRGDSDLPVTTSKWWKNPKITMLDKKTYIKETISMPGIFKFCERLERADQKAMRRRKRMKELMKRRSMLKRKDPYEEEDGKTAVAENEVEIETISEEINHLRYGRE